MKRLIKKCELYYHLTNNENFSIDPNFNNKQQEMGQGLYLTNLEYLKKWDNLLMHRDYVVEIEANLNIIKEDNFPSRKIMVKELISNGYNAEKMNNCKPTGDTFNRDPMDIAIKREWAKLNGYDAIEVYLDEGYQIVVLNYDKLNILSIKTIYDYI